MNTEINEVEINGVKYIRKDSVKASPELDKSGYCLVRSTNAGVFYGFVKEKDMAKGEAIILNARRVWYWSGAASLSQLAVDGTSKPKDCKFPCAVEVLHLGQVIEIIPLTNKALESLNSVAVWKQ